MHRQQVVKLSLSVPVSLFAIGDSTQLVVNWLPTSSSWQAKVDDCLFRFAVKLLSCSNNLAILGRLSEFIFQTVVSVKFCLCRQQKIWKQTAADLQFLMIYHS